MGTVLFGAFIAAPGLTHSTPAKELQTGRSCPVESDACIGPSITTGAELRCNVVVRTTAYGPIARGSGKWQVFVASNTLIIDGPRGMRVPPLNAVVGTAAMPWR
jgi:hypothetical protein